VSNKLKNLEIKLVNAQATAIRRNCNKAYSGDWAEVERIEAEIEKLLQGASHE
jgi:hypothetical protein